MVWVLSGCAIMLGSVFSLLVIPLFMWIIRRNFIQPEEAMLQQLNAERARRAQVTEAEGTKRAVELNADAELYAAEQKAKARRILADAEAYATSAVAKAIAENGLEAAQYQVALKQVEAVTAVGQSAGNQTVLVPASIMDAFGDAFKMLKGRG